MPILEVRTIYRVERSSLVITLPRSWLKYFRLRAGDKVEVIGNGELTIHPLKGRNDEADSSQATPYQR